MPGSLTTGDCQRSRQAVTSTERRRGLGEPPDRGGTHAARTSGLHLPCFGRERSVILVDVLIDPRPMLPWIFPVASDDASTLATCRPLFRWDVVACHHVLPFRRSFAPGFRPRTYLSRDRSGARRFGDGNGAGLPKSLDIGRQLTLRPPDPTEGTRRGPECRFDGRRDAGGPGIHR
jgi:hypothetical protein